MALSIQQVRQLLLPEEPNYPLVARYGAALLPHLRTIIRGSDEMLASKAAYVATLVASPAAAAVVSDAAKSGSAIVRVAVAGGARNIRTPQAGSLLMALLSDGDPGVRTAAVKASVGRKNAALTAKIRTLSQSDPTSSVRVVATALLRRSGSGLA